MLGSHRRTLGEDDILSLVAVRQCQVVIRDSRGCRNEMMTVTAETLFEAAALALRVLSEQGFNADDPAGEIEVHVSSPDTKHTVPVHRVLAWLESSSPPRKEHALKARLRGTSR
jgi:hypothetical protein